LLEALNLVLILSVEVDSCIDLGPKVFDVVVFSGDCLLQMLNFISLC
jgi:hypothetical protein